MRQITISMTFLLFSALSAASIPFDLSKLKAFESQLEDVMEITDVELLKRRVVEVEREHALSTTELNRARLGIVYHEAALNAFLVPELDYEDHAERSFRLLDSLYQSPETTEELMPFVASYRASAMALWAGQSRNLKLLSKAFKGFGEAVEKYAEVSYCPEFMRGSVAENLPKILFSKRKYAKLDMQSIIEKQERNAGYAPAKIMSFTYWAWANQRQGKKHREEALAYLDRAIALDPEYEGGRKRAEELKAKLSR